MRGSMTERYEHLSPDVKNDAVKLLDAPVNGASMARTGTDN